VPGLQPNSVHPDYKTEFDADPTSWSFHKHHYFATCNERLRLSLQHGVYIRTSALPAAIAVEKWIPIWNEDLKYGYDNPRTRP